MCQGHPVSGPAHLLLPEGDHPPGVLKARCGAVLPTVVPQHGQLPPGLKCERSHAGPPLKTLTRPASPGPFAPPPA